MAATRAPSVGPRTSVVFVVYAAFAKLGGIGGLEMVGATTSALWERARPCTGYGAVCGPGPLSE